MIFVQSSGQELHTHLVIVMVMDQCTVMATPLIDPHQPDPLIHMGFPHTPMGLHHLQSLEITIQPITL